MSGIAKNIERLSLVELEERIAPAGGVSVSISNGNLIVVGDDDANSIVIDDESLRAGELRVSAGDGATLINGSSDPYVAQGITGNVTITLKDGDDALEVSGVSITGGLKVDGGDGHDDVLVSGSTIGKSAMLKSCDADISTTAITLDLVIANTTAGGQVSLSADIGRNARIATVDGDVAVSNASVLNLFSITDKAGGAVSLTDTDGGQLRIRNGLGDSAVSITGGTMTGSATINNGTGNDTVAISGLLVRGTTRIANGAGNSTTTITDSVFEDAFSDARNCLSVANGEGHDELLISGCTFNQNVRVMHGSGGSLSKVFDSYGYGIIAVRTGAGADQMEFAGLEVGTGIGAVTGADNDTVFVDDCQTFVLAVLGGAGDDAVNLETI
ncbi:hypothetical protein L0Y59_04880, partial [Candidatus Uhrbacteria bacterium]|nr:hypothetical protein [Candidatus Uhrbacteria bacterium]